MKLKRMSVHDFKRYIEAKEIVNIYYISGEQRDYDPAESYQLKLRFDRIVVYENPDTLYLYTEDKSISQMTFPHIVEFVFQQKASVENGEAIKIVSNSYPGCSARDLTIQIEYRA